MSTLEETPRLLITTENRDVKEEKEFGWSKDPYKNSSVDDRSRVSCATFSIPPMVPDFKILSRRLTTDPSANGTSARRTRTTSTARSANGAAASGHRSGKFVATRT